jgi:hypothetical protein
MCAHASNLTIVPPAKRATRATVPAKPKAPAKPRAKNLSPEQQTARNAKVVTDRIKLGLTWVEVAKRNGVKERQCRYIVRRWMEEGGANVSYADPTKVVDDLLAGYQADHWELTEAADAAWEQNNINAVIGAVKNRMDARQKTVELLQATGRLPKNLGQLRVIYDVRFLIEQVMEVFDQHDIPVAARRALVEKLGPVIDGQESEQVPEAA